MAVDVQALIRLKNLVARIYAMASKEGHGRGRARGKVIRQEDSDKNPDEPKKTDLWDDDVATSTETFDLADFAKAALKFRTDMEDFKGNLGFDEPFRQNDDAITSLIDHTPENIVPNVLHGTSLPPEASVSSLLLEDANDVATNPLGVSSIAAVLNNTTSDIFSLDLGAPLGGIFSGVENVEVVEWFYTDPQNNTQGPFPQDTMRLWNEEGYFTADLPIKLRRWTKFHLFKDVFPNQATAFIDIPQEPVSFFLQDEVSPFRGVPQTFQAVVDETPVEPVQPPVKSDLKPIESVATSHNVEKSDFAKKLLGIGRSKPVVEPKSIDVQIEPVQVVPPTFVVDDELLKEEAPSAGKTAPIVVDTPTTIEKIELSKSTEAPNKPTKGWNSASTKPVVRLTEIQQQQQKEETQSKPVVRQVVSPTAPTQSLSMSVQLKSLLGVKEPKNVWSTNGPPDVAVNSLKDIMKEEISRKHSNETSVSAEMAEIVKPTGTSWAAKARSAVTPVAQPVRSPITSSISVDQKPVSAGRPAILDVHEEAKSQPIVTLSKASSQPQAKSGFGGKLMSKELSDWCSSQLIKITGSDDAMELMEFCMSLKSSVEIRSYLSQYLGSSPQVTNFATEFISLKDGKKFVTVEKIHDQKFQNVVNKKKKPVVK